MMDDEMIHPSEDKRLKKCLQGSIRIYGSWDASDHSHYGFIYRTALLEITSISFQKRKHLDTASVETSSFFNTCAFSECHPVNSNGSIDSEYYVCLEMKNVKCYTLRSLPFHLHFNKNGQCEISTNIVISVKYPHFNHLKANYMTLSIQKKNRSKSKLLKFHQTVAHVYINMEYVLQNNRINSVTLDCSKSKVFDSCEVYFKSISTNAIPTATNSLKKSLKNRWQLKGLPYPQMNFTRMFSPKLKRNFSYTKNNNVFNVASGSDEEPNMLCYGDSSESANSEYSFDATATIDANADVVVDNQDKVNQGKNINFIYSLVNTPELTPDAVNKIMSTTASNSPKLSRMADEDNNQVSSCRRNLLLVEPNVFQTHNALVSDKSTKKGKMDTQDYVARFSDSSANIETDDSSSHTSDNINVNVKPNKMANFDNISNNSNENDVSSFVMPANILVFISDGVSTIPKKLYELFSCRDHSEINCVYLKSSTWIRQFIEEWNLIVNSEDLSIDENCQPKCRIFLFGNDKTINKYINELALCKIAQSILHSQDNEKRQISVTSKFLEFLFIPIDFPSCYFEHINKITSSTLYKDCFGGKFWQNFITNGALVNRENYQQSYDHLINFITTENYEVVECPIGKVVLSADKIESDQPVVSKDTEDITCAFVSSCQILNSGSSQLPMSAHTSQSSISSSSKYIIEYNAVGDESLNKKKMKVKNPSKIIFIPHVKHIEISIISQSAERYSFTKKMSKSNSNKKTLKAENVRIYRYSKNTNLKFDVFVDGIVHNRINSLNVSYNWNNLVKTLPMSIPTAKNVTSTKELNENYFVEKK